MWLTINLKLTPVQPYVTVIHCCAHGAVSARRRMRTSISARLICELRTTDAEPKPGVYGKEKNRKKPKIMKAKKEEEKKEEEKKTILTSTPIFYSDCRGWRSSDFIFYHSIFLHTIPPANLSLSPTKTLCLGPIYIPRRSQSSSR